MQKSLYEILVPAEWGPGSEINVEYHKKWDEHVRSIAGGLTIFKPARGQWIDAPGKVDGEDLFDEKMIPVRIMCTAEEIEQIADYTGEYYGQKAVMYYLVSAEVVIKYYGGGPG